MLLSHSTAILEQVHLTATFNSNIYQQELNIKTVELIIPSSWDSW